MRSGEKRNRVVGRATAAVMAGLASRLAEIKGVLF